MPDDPQMATHSNGNPIGKTRRMLRGRPELSILTLLILLAGGIWVFVGIADEVADGDTHDLDKAVLLMFRDSADPAEPLGPPWLAETMRDVTALGSFVVLGFVTFAVAGYLCLRRRAALAAVLLVANIGGSFISAGLKSIFDRPRPEFGLHDLTLYTSSFPSQHSMMSAIVYMTVGALLARVQPTAALRGYVLGLAVLLALAAGLSRLYLGVHWPSDVLAGWVAGGVWAIGFWLIARRLRAHGNVEYGEDQTDAEPRRDQSG